MNTLLGEEGINLSGGQKQIIALIRVLYKKPKLLLLNEFNSAMDRKTKLFVLQMFNKFKSELSIIFISHRLYSLRYIADKIYIIEQGETKVYGTHSQLLETSNFHSDYWLELNNVILTKNNL